MYVYDENGHPLLKSDASILNYVALATTGYAVYKGVTVDHNLFTALVSHSLTVTASLTALWGRNMVGSMKHTYADPIPDDYDQVREWDLDDYRSAMKASKGAFIAAALSLSVSFGTAIIKDAINPVELDAQRQEHATIITSSNDKSNTEIGLMLVSPTPLKLS